MTDTDAAPIFQRLDAIAARLDNIERQLALLPDLLFLASDPTAQRVIEALRKDATVRSLNRPQPASFDAIPVPQR